METLSVAKRYAQTLYDYAIEEDARDAVREDCLAIRRLLDCSAELAGLVDNPTLAPEVADQAITALFGKQAHAVTMRFLRFLAAKGRLSKLRDICDRYEQHICWDLGILKVKITAAHQLSDAQLAMMKQKLHMQYNKTIDAEVDVDASLIGGFKIQVGDHIQDLSIATKLEQFQQCVIGAQHEHPKQKVKSWR